MNIAIIAASYLPKKGGVESLCSALATSFKKKGHKILVITKKYPRTLQRKESIKSIEVRRYVFFDPKGPENSLRSYAAYMYTLALAPLHFLKFVLRLRLFRPAVIYYHFVGGPTFFLLLYRFLFKTRLIVSMHGEDVRILASESKMGKVLFQLVTEKAEIVVANSFYNLRKAQSIEPSIHNKSRVIYNGINPEEFVLVKAYQYPRRYMLCVSRLVGNKGVDVLIKAFAQFAPSLPAIDLIIAGEGPDRSGLEELARAAGLDKRVLFFGSLEKSKIAALLKGCEFLVLPSRYEAFGIVILEAMACRKMVLATRSGGPQEILREGVTGLLVDSDSVPALAAGIEIALNDTEMRNKIADNLQQFTVKFDIKYVAEQYLCLAQR